MSCGIKREAVTAWESGATKTISSDVLFDAARTLAVDPEWLATGRGTREPLGTRESAPSYFAVRPAAATVIALVRQLAGDSNIPDAVFDSVATLLRLIPRRA